MIHRTAGEGRYAHVEREQRWILRTLPDGLAQPVSILDLYISGTRLRLRRMESNRETVHKLAQKVRPASGGPETVKLTNMYLSEPEYSVLARLGGAEIRKTRRQWAGGGRPMSVDEFGGELAGLILAEVELRPDEPRGGDPPLAVADVTDDDRFSGGTLAHTSAEVMRSLLATFGVPPAP